MRASISIGLELKEKGGREHDADSKRYICCQSIRNGLLWCWSIQPQL